MNFFNLKIDEFYKQKKKKNNFRTNKYWNNFANFKDPDGKKRNLMSERKKKIKDLKNEISFIKKNVKIKKPRIIDLGCGFGFFLNEFGKNWEKIGIEVSNLAIKKNSSNLKIYNFDLEKKLTHDKLKLLGKFDVVFTYHVIEHLNNPEQLIYNSYKLLKNNGFLIIGTPNFDSGCARKFGKKYRFFNDKTHISFFSENSLFRLLNKYGFNVEKVDFPFFETEHFNKKNLLRLLNEKKVSPPFYGNIMSFYCVKKTKKQIQKEKKLLIKNYTELLKNISK
tara:strand:- start:4567 stop:5403 length:837 start_codon:yes stop_codon:yes gene_type:complete